MTEFEKEHESFLISLCGILKRLQASDNQLKRIADALEKQVDIAQRTLDRINEIK